MASSTIYSQVSATFFALLIADSIPASWEPTLLSLASTSRAHYAALQSHRYRHSNFFLPVDDQHWHVLESNDSPHRCGAKLEQAEKNQLTHLMRSWEVSGPASISTFSATDTFGLAIPPSVQSLAMTGQVSFPSRGLPQGLTKLELQLAGREDAFALTRCIKSNGLPRLAALKLADIPDLVSWWTSSSAVMPGLGHALLRLAPTLKELDVSLVNRNRPATWDHGQDIFPRPEDRGSPAELHFDLLFPGAANAENGEDDPVRFELTSLKLRHFGIPSDAFDWIFDVSELTALEIPSCAVDPAAWADLRTEAVSLKDVVCTRPWKDESGSFKAFLGELMWRDAKAQVLEWAGRWTYEGMWKDEEAIVWRIEKIYETPDDGIAGEWTWKE